MSLIDRDVAIDAIQKNINEMRHNEKYHAELVRLNGELIIGGIEIALAVVKNLPTIEPEPKWIPVSERLPEEGCDVLITKEPFKIKGYKQEVIKAKRSVDPRSGKIKWRSEFGTLPNKAVLAWMPLPEPYRGEGDE